MIAQERIAILGLGLVGGSLARDLSARGAQVMGYDIDPLPLRAAQRARAIREIVDSDFTTLATATIVVLCVPVDAAPTLLEAIAPHLGATTLVTDVGSTKLAIGTRAATLGVRTRFVGAHPMAGDHRAGFAASTLGMFTGARVYLCPSAESSTAAKTKALDLWHALGADVRWTTPEAHDAEVAYTSHLPHLLSAALARTIERAGHDRAALGAGGQSMTRLAASSPAMWQAIVATNHEAIARALADCAAELEAVRETVARGDMEAICRLFTHTGRWLAEPTP